jgi:hypothetical protein
MKLFLPLGACSLSPHTQAGELDSQNWQVTEHGHRAMSVPSLMTAQGGAHHARLYCKPLSHIVCLIKKARAFSQLL